MCECNSDSGYMDAELTSPALLQLVIPPVHALLIRALTALVARSVLFLAGFVWISVETVSLRRTA